MAKIANTFKKCEKCRKVFQLVYGNSNRFCSRSCYWKELSGKSFSPSTEFKKGIVPRTIFKKGQTSGDKNVKWKGELAGYDAKHDWIYRHYGKPTHCEICKTTSKEKRICWANKDHLYKRIKSDWFMACYKCHWHYDKD